MKFRLLIAVVFAAIGLCAQANATREYYLVGLRHVYMFDVWPDGYKQERQALEEEYSDAVAAAQQEYDTNMASIRDEEAKDNGLIHQIDRDAVQQNLEQDIADAADKRDEGLSQLYVQCDYVRDAHPEFQIDQDGPYEVMGCDVDPTGQFIDVCFHRPYKTYTEPCPYGWTYGQWYPFFSLVAQRDAFRAGWVAMGSPAFAPIYRGGERIMVLAPIRLDVIVSRKNWAGGRPPRITDNDRALMTQYKDLQRKAGLRPPSSRPVGAKRVRQIAPAGVVSRYVKPPSRRGSIAAGAEPSRYSHTPSRGPVAPPEPPRGRPVTPPARGSSGSGDRKKGG